MRERGRGAAAAWVADAAGTDAVGAHDMQARRGRLARVAPAIVHAFARLGKDDIFARFRGAAVDFVGEARVGDKGRGKVARVAKARAAVGDVDDGAVLRRVSGTMHEGVMGLNGPRLFSSCGDAVAMKHAQYA